MDITRHIGDISHTSAGLKPQFQLCQEIVKCSTPSEQLPIDKYLPETLQTGMAGVEIKQWIYTR